MTIHAGWLFVEMAVVAQWLWLCGGDQKVVSSHPTTAKKGSVGFLWENAVHWKKNEVYNLKSRLADY